MIPNLTPILRATATYIRPGVHAGVATAVAATVFYGSLAAVGGVSYVAFCGGRATWRGARRAGSCAREWMPSVHVTVRNPFQAKPPVPLAPSPYGPVINGEAVSA